MLLVFIIAMGLVFNAADAFDVCYQARLLSRYTVIARSAAFLVFMLVRIALILGEFSVAWFAAATTLELALGGSCWPGLTWETSNSADAGCSTWRPCPAC
jgi:hypothetical protein